MEQKLQKLINDCRVHKKIYEALGYIPTDLLPFDLVIETCEKLLQVLTEVGFDDSNYVQLYSSQINQINDCLSFRGHEDSAFVVYQDENWKHSVSIQYDNVRLTLINLALGLKFQIKLFEQIGYLNSNVVIVGANGSGKTSLSEKLKYYLNNNGIVISAQRILRLPNFDSISNPASTEAKLKGEQARTKTYKNIDDFGFMISEFEIVLRHLLAENISASTKYKGDALIRGANNVTIEVPSKTNLDYVFEIWNSLIEHRTIGSEDGINIKTYIKESGNSYPSIQMSDGEKVMLYLIAQVLLAPSDGFIVVDEPEMYLHKTILKRLWDTLESRRNDCLFIYLTHDLDFATSRNGSKKIWIKSYSHPDLWDIESIESDEIPEALLLELLGSRKNILFCEGERGSLDELIYSRLFKNYTISPVGSCFDVITHTKAFNKIKNVNVRAYGLIDSDHHSHARLQQIRVDNIFHCSLPEIENLFLDIEFLTVFATIFLVDLEKIDIIKTEVINCLSREIELQVSNYISAKINNIFTDTDLHKGNSLDGVKRNYEKFLQNIDIDEFHNKRRQELEEIISQKDYKRALSVFNNKGLKAIPSKYFGVTDFKDKCLKIIASKPEVIEIFNKYFPIELFE